MLQVSRGGWHSIDITAAVRELLLSSADSTGQLILGVRFEAPRSKIISPAHFLNTKDNTTAFLMLFTEESDNELSHDNHKKPHITPQHIQILTDLLTAEGEHAKKRHPHHTKEQNPKRHKHIKLEDGNGDIKELIDMERIKSLKRHHKFHDINSVHKHDFKNFDQWFEDSETKRVIRSIDSYESKTHKRRSIYDNELPYEKLHIHKEHKILTTEEPKEVTTETPKDYDDDDKNLIPYPPGMKRKRKKKNRRSKKRNQRSKTTKFPDEWHQVS